LAGCCAPVRGAGAESTTGEKNSVMAPADPCSGALAGYVRACARARLGRNPLAVARTARSNAASRWA
jgi:hypothetical protein